MTTNYMNRLVQHLRRSMAQDGAGKTDGQLLECFVLRRDTAALAALVRRHGPMVWGVCCRLLRGRPDAEDAFQATFLVLVQKAASLPDREMVGNWLYGVAQQTSLRMRALAARRSARERQVAVMPEPTRPERSPWNEIRPILDEELACLPDKYRVLIVLCDLEGKTRKETACQLALPEGTVASRLATARTMLAKRLTRRGIVVSGGLLGSLLSASAAPACVPRILVSSTVKAAVLAAAGQVVQVSSSVATLITGVTKAMVMSKIKSVLAVAMIVGLALVGAGTGVGVITHAEALAQQTSAGPDDDNQGKVVSDGNARPSRVIPETAKTPAGVPVLEDIPYLGRMYVVTKQPGKEGAKSAGKVIQMRIAEPPGMKVALWPPAKKDEKGRLDAVETPVRVNLEQGKRTGFKLFDIPNRPGLVLFASVLIPKLDAAGEAFVTGNAVPLSLTDEDFDTGAKGLTTRLIVLKGGQPSIRALYGKSEANAIEVARQQGVVLAVVRVGDVFAVTPRPQPRGITKIDIGDDPRLPLLRSEKGQGLSGGRQSGPQANDLDRLKLEALDAKSQNEDMRKRMQQAELMVRELATVQKENQSLRQRVKDAVALMVRELKAAQGENEQLRHRAENAEAQVRSLQDALARREQDLARLKEELSRARDKK